MSRASDLGNQLLWLVGHLVFTSIINLTAFGGYHAYQWYLSTQPTQIDLAQLSNDELNQISKEAFIVQQDRRRDK